GRASGFRCGDPGVDSARHAGLPRAAIGEDLYALSSVWCVVGGLPPALGPGVRRCVGLARLVFADEPRPNGRTLGARTAERPRPIQARVRGRLRGQPRGIPPIGDDRLSWFSVKMTAVGGLLRRPKPPFVVAIGATR